MDGKSNEDILIYDVAYKTPNGVNPLRFIFGKVDGYDRKYDGTKYLRLSHFNEKYEK